MIWTAPVSPLERPLQLQKIIRLLIIFGPLRALSFFTIRFSVFEVIRRPASLPFHRIRCASNESATTPANKLTAQDMAYNLLCFYNLKYIFIKAFVLTTRICLLDGFSMTLALFGRLSFFAGDPATLQKSSNDFPKNNSPI